MKCKKCKCTTAMIDITRMPDADGMRKLMCDASTGGCGKVIKYKPIVEVKTHIAKPAIPPPMVEPPPPVIEPQVTVTMDEPEAIERP